MKTGITIVSAEYVEGYKIKIIFSDGRINIFDYENMVMRDHEESLPYRNINTFKKFKIVSKDKIAWGKDWDMLLSLDTIYNKQSISFAGRKKISDKKILLPLYIRQSTINEHGGIDATRQKVTKFLETV